MADEKKILIDVQVNIDNAIKALAETKSQIEVLKASQKSLGKITDENRAEYEAYAAQIRQLNTVARQQQKEIDNTIKAQKAESGSNEQLSARLSILTAQYNKLSKAKKESAAGIELQKSIKSISDELAKTEGNLGNFTRRVGDYQNQILGAIGLNGGFIGNLIQMSIAAKGAGMTFGNQFTMGIKAAGKALLSLLASPVVLLLAGITAIGAGFVGLVKNSMEFSKALSELKAITGAAGADLDFLKEKAKDLAAEYGKSATEIVEAMKMVGSAKPELLDNVQALSDMTESVITLSKATGLDLKESTSSLATIMNQFGLSALDADKAINVLAAGSKYGAVEVDYLKDSIVKVGTIAASAGLSIEQTTAAMEVFGQMGVKAEIAGTGFKNILGTLQADTKNYTNGVFDLNKAIDNNANISEDNIALQDKFGKEFYGLAGILFKNKELFNELTKNITGTNVAFEQAAIATDNLSGDLDKMKSGWNAFLLSLEDGDGVIARTFRGLIQWATESIGALKTLTKSSSEREIESIKNVANARVDDFKKYLSQEKDKEKYINQEIQAEKNLVKTKTSAINELSEQIKKNEEWVASTEEYLKTTRGIEFERRKNLTSTKQEIEANKEKLKNLKQQVSTSNTYINSLGGIRGELALVGKAEETNSDAAIELTKKQLAERIKIAQKIAKAEVDIQNIKSQTIIDKQNEIANNDKKSYTDRLEALGKSEAEQIAIINRNRDLELKNKELTEAERNAITQKAAYEVQKIKSDTEKTITDIEAKELDNRLKLESENLAAKKQQLSNDQSKELKELSDKFAKGNISATEYEKQKLEIAQKYRELDFNQSVLALASQLGLENLNADQRKEIERQIAETKNKYAQESAQIAIQANEKIVETEKQAADKRKEIEQQLTDKKKELFTQLQTTLQDITNGVFERKNTEIDEETQKITESYDTQIKAAEGNDKRQEQLEAQKQKKLDEQDAKKRKLARQQAIFEKSFQAMQIGISTAKSVGDITLKVAEITAAAALNPLLIPSIGIAASQIPIAIGTGALQLASVLATPLPKAAKGKVFKGKSHAQGGIPVEVEGDEMILTKGVYRNPALREIASVINQAGGGIPLSAGTSNTYMATGGVLSNALFQNDGGYSARSNSSVVLTKDDIKQAMSEAVKGVKIITTVEDIRKADANYVNLENRANF